MVRPNMSNPRPPRITNTPTVVTRCGDEQEGNLYSPPAPPSHLFLGARGQGSTESSQLTGRVSRAARRVKGSEGNLRRRINCYASNAGTGCNSPRGRRADRQCCNRGSETVVVGGVTSAQGARESRAQGEGSQGSDTHHHWNTQRTGGTRPHQEARRL